MLTQGPWDPNAQYGGAPAALLTWAVERVPTLVPMRIARITIDMHRQVPLGRLEVDAEVAREGKRLQVVVATVRDPTGSRWRVPTVLRFRLGTGPDAPTDPRLRADRDPAVGSGAGSHAARPPAASTGSSTPPEMREGGTAERGDELVPGHPTGDRGRGDVADGAPGVGVRLHRELRQLPRPDAVVGDQRRSHHHAGRAPQGEWTGVATRAWYAHDGIGHARADLFDRDGFVGTCTASLLVDEVAAPY